MIDRMIERLRGFERIELNRLLTRMLRRYAWLAVQLGVSEQEMIDNLRTAFWQEECESNE